MSFATSTTVPVSSQPSSPATADQLRVPKTGDKESLTTPLPSLTDVKDRRAYEHGRQKVKKAADFVKMRTQKARVVIDPSWPTRAPREKPRSIAAEEELDTDTVLVVNETSTRRSTILAEVKFDVKLADLIIAPRKPLKRSDSEFEVIPHLKSVIVLDDIASNDFGIDEPWEHVFGDDDSDVKAPSYATVLASPK